ncbi:DUF4365 domain-containing protein, partial [bacterium]|nr:DUF4365 domain-containing protein [bacterium]
MTGINENKKFPQIRNTAKVDAKATSFVRQLFMNSGGHILNKVEHDFGTDYRVQFNCQGSARGYSANLQVKGTEAIETEEYYAFKYPAEVKNLNYLYEHGDPSYYIIHNCKFETTYYREVNEIVTELDVCQPGWQDQDKVGILIFANKPLDSEAILSMQKEAYAWSHERKETKKRVKYLGGEISKYAMIVDQDEQGEEAGNLRLMLKGYHRGKRLADLIDTFEFNTHLLYCMTLIKIYESRGRHHALPTGWTMSSLGHMTLSQLTSRLENAINEYHRLRDELSWVSIPDSPPLDGEHEPKEFKSSSKGLSFFEYKRYTGEELKCKLRLRFEQIGLEVEKSQLCEDDLIVSKGGTIGIISLSIFDKKIKKNALAEFRNKTETIGAHTAAVLINPEQAMSLNLIRWNRDDDGNDKLKIPIGTLMPILTDFESNFVTKLIRQTKLFPQMDISSYKNGWSLAIPGHIELDNPITFEFQQQIVRNYAPLILKRIEEGYFVSFTWVDPHRNVA